MGMPLIFRADSWRSVECSSPFVYVHRYRFVLQLSHAPQFLSSFIHCGCIREVTSSFCYQFIICKLISGQYHPLYCSCWFLEDFSSKIPITYPAGLVDLVNPILKSLSILTIKHFDWVKHRIIWLILAGSHQLLEACCWLLWLAAIISSDLDCMLASSIRVMLKSCPGIDPNGNWW